jgi:hypothetical protein
MYDDVPYVLLLSHAYELMFIQNSECMSICVIKLYKM